MTELLPQTVLTYAVLVAIGVTGGLGDIWIYHWARTDRTLWLVTSCAVWLASILLFGLMLKWDQRGLSAAFMLATVFHVLPVLVVDLLYYGGTLSKLEWLGIAVGLLSVVLLELGRRPPPDEAAPAPTVATPDPERQS